MRNRRRVYAIDHKISRLWRKSFGEKETHKREEEKRDEGIKLEMDS